MVLPARRSILPKRQRSRYVDLSLDRIDIVARPGEVVAADVRQEYGEDDRRAQAGLIEVGNGDVGRGGVGDGGSRDRVGDGDGIGVYGVVGCRRRSKLNTPYPVTKSPEGKEP